MCGSDGVVRVNDPSLSAVLWVLDACDMHPQCPLPTLIYLTGHLGPRARLGDDEPVT